MFIKFDFVNNNLKKNMCTWLFIYNLIVFTVGALFVKQLIRYSQISTLISCTGFILNTIIFSYDTIKIKSRQNIADIKNFILQHSA